MGSALPRQLFNDPRGLSLGMFGDDPDANDEPLKPYSVPLPEATLRMGNQVLDLVALKMFETELNQGGRFVPKFES